ncbi:cytochrome c [Curvibacter sp. HBC61]|uniref:Cytochrome c n=1 Tax=Curvibacter cyanobacteriorum TaxID=3026422 RepID=A0ABT5MXC1_9BURK|nr:cytochrome c [Curvibacter sp. HBC61]MDD0837427.1 cytochrome c [Curvibacter sp. HBC61]
MRRQLQALMAVLLLGLFLVALVAWLNVRGELPVGDAAPLPASAQQVAQGAYLARVGNCMACHTVPGGAPFAGGRGIETPFGVVYSSNLTPDEATGLGRWNADHFWRAMHHGRSRDGRLLYPAFPYTEYTRVSRSDSDALYAYLRSLPAVAQPNRDPALDWPYRTQAALAVWRALYFKPEPWEPEPAQTPLWNRGAYLVQGLGHCATCHTPRDALGGLDRSRPLTGQMLTAQRWYAPSLVDPAEAGLMGWSAEQAARLLRSGVNDHAVVTGPMAEVVFRSTQYLGESDLNAMVHYLQALPVQATPARAAVAPVPLQLSRGAQLYGQHCAACHGEQGQGVAGAYPALAGNRAVTLAQPANLIRIVLQGGYAPATQANPRPHGMAPFRQQLADDEVAAVLSFLRESWGHHAGGVSTLDLLRDRESAAP